MEALPPPPPPIIRILPAFAEQEPDYPYEENPYFGPFENLPLNVQEEIYTSRLSLELLRDKLPPELVEAIVQEQNIIFGEVLGEPIWNWDDREEIALQLAQFEGLGNPIDQIQERRGRSQLDINIDNSRKIPEISFSQKGIPLELMVLYIRVRKAFPDFDPNVYPDSGAMSVLVRDGNDEVFHIIAFINLHNRSNLNMLFFADATNGPFARSMVETIEVENVIGIGGTVLPDFSYEVQIKHFIPPTNSSDIGALNQRSFNERSSNSQMGAQRTSSQFVPKPAYRRK